jgi:hypothetical protein
MKRERKIEKSGPSLLIGVRWSSDSSEEERSESFSKEGGEKKKRGGAHRGR